MKAYTVYTDDGGFNTVISDDNEDEFWDMVNNNGWDAEEINK